MSRAVTSTAISVAIRGGIMSKRCVQEVLVSSSAALQGGPNNQPVDVTTAGTLQASASNAKKPMSGCIRALTLTAAQQQGAGKK
eukprot:365725-Chlamydomonas_euryale.AAC.3